MKRVLCLLMLMVMLLTMSAPAEESRDETLISEWMNCLYDYEWIFTMELWALGYAQDFCSDSSWENLMKARAAVDAVIQELSLMEEPVPSLTSKDYLQMLEDDVDLSFIQTEYASFAQARDDTLLQYVYLQDQLLNGVYWTYDIGHLKEWVASKQTLLAWERQYYADITNAVVNALQNDEMRDSVIDFYQENCPVIFEGYSGWQSEKELVEDQVTAALEGYEEAIGAYNKLLSIAEENLNTYFHALESGDLTILFENRYDIADLPPFLPDPGWYEPELAEMVYYWEDESTGEKSFAQVAEDINGIPDGCVLQYDQVSEEMLTEYTALLSLLGVETIGQKDEDGVRKIFFELYEVNFVIEWDGSKASFWFVDLPLAFVPEWYIYSLAQG